jgi:hypothetical protein
MGENLKKAAQPMRAKRLPYYGILAGYWPNENPGARRAAGSQNAAVSVQVPVVSVGF